MPQEFVFQGSQTRFRCDLHAQTCGAQTRQGARCKRRTVVGLGLCWTHLRSLKRLKIQESTLPGAGRGLFAVDPEKQPGSIVFRTGQKIADYDGDMITAADAARRYGPNTGPYAIASTRQRREDAACRRGVGSLANTARGTGRRNNARLSRRNDGTHTLKATRPIRNHEEILIPYSGSYRFDGQASHATRRRRAG